jgi:hypothetical protein
MKKIILPILISIMGCAAYLSVNAQPNSSYSVELNEEEQTAVNALVLYPKTTRSIIMKASSHPEAIVRIESIQLKTSEAFKSLLQQYPESAQATLWDLTRYPNLIERLSSGESLPSLLPDYPEVVHTGIRLAKSQYSEVIASIQELNQKATSAFEDTWQNYPVEDQEALRSLIELPEVLSLLTEHVRLTIIVGDLYKRNPVWIEQKADSLHLIVAREQAQELEDWKQSIKDNPKVMDDLKASANVFKEENTDLTEYEYDYDDDEYFDSVEDDLYYENQAEEERVIHHYYHYNYPYWFGYPYWYDYPRWRPYPTWWDWGFYWTPNQTIVVFGLPSFHFTNWYFYYPNHHYHYPHLSAHFVNHYYGHRAHGSSITTSVNTWASRNRQVVNEDWLRDDDRLPKRFEEFGKAEMARNKYNSKYPNRVLSQTEFVEKNKNRYPELNKSVRKTQIEQAEVKKEPRTTFPKNPTVTSPNVKTPRKIIPKVKTPSNKRAQDYHRNTWEKSKRTTIPQVRKPSVKTPSIKTPKRTKTVQKPRKPNG